MQNFRIEGKIHLPEKGRLTDYLALVERKFIPVTQASIYLVPSNELLHSVDFLSLNKDSVIFIFPKQIIQEKERGELNV